MSTIDFESHPITEIVGTVTVHSLRGKNGRTENRKSYALSLCIDGQITYVHNGVEYVSDKNHAVILPKGKSYELRREKTGDFPVINFNCVGNLCDTVTPIRTENTEELVSLYKKIRALVCSSGNKMRTLSLFYEMLHVLTESDTPYVLREALRIINEQYSSPSLTNERLAAACGVSEVYFRRIFTNHLGTSPKQYIIDFRLKRAKQLLTENARSVREISEDCGFASPYHFARIFREHEGLTPTEYRRKNRIYGI